MKFKLNRIFSSEIKHFGACCCRLKAVWIFQELKFNMLGLFVAETRNVCDDKSFAFTMSQAANNGNMLHLPRLRFVSWNRERRNPNNVLDEPQI